MEQAGAVLGLLSAAALAPGLHVMLCCDNGGAVATLRRGSSQTVLGRQLSSVFWAVAAFFGCAVWVESARSAVNAADPPSRVCPFSSKPCERPVDFGPPETFKSIFRDKMTLLQSQFGVNPAGADFGAPFPCVEKSMSRDSRKPRLMRN